MRTIEDYLACIDKTLARMADTGERLVAAIDDLNASVKAMTAVVSAVLTHEQQMQGVIDALQKAAASAPADQTAAISAAAAAITSSVATLKATVPAPATPAA